jgi:hypothetical protein
VGLEVMGMVGSGALSALIALIEQSGEAPYITDSREYSIL